MMLQDKAVGGLLYINLDVQLHNTIEESTLWEQMRHTVPSTIVEACAQRQRICQAKAKIRAVAHIYNHVMLRLLHSTCELHLLMDHDHGNDT